ncbi:hypothetical protein B9Z55_025521 [Caenorhabditis nigoni]|uniref:Uncharacterized protein n=1 Tax=Caenorhabditis nigoni TaxID=1611254 RepID=A0A2G5SZ76_9PELO|nr:hypothetical protein B9Z55_025521 [Caenorhabditis nigoni]
MRNYLFLLVLLAVSTAGDLLPTYSEADEEIAKANQSKVKNQEFVSVMNHRILNNSKIMKNLIMHKKKTIFTDELVYTTSESKNINSNRCQKLVITVLCNSIEEIVISLCRSACKMFFGCSECFSGNRSLFCSDVYLMTVKAFLVFPFKP